MPDIASLGLQIDSSQVVDGKKALDQFADASAKADQGARSLNGQMADTSKIMRAQAEQARAAAAANTAMGTSTSAASIGAQIFIDKLQEQVAVLGMSRSQLAAYQAAQLGVSKEAEASVAKLKAYEDQIKALADAKAAATQKTNYLTDAIKLLAAGYGALKLGEYIKDAALLAARYETLGVVSEVVGRNAGYTKTQMDTATQAIAAQGITMLESRQSAIKLVQAHVDLKNATSLARIAQDAAVIGNLNSSEAFDRLVNGIARGNVLILRNIGINVNLQSAYQQMADSLGKGTKELTENERVQARLNAVIEHGTDISGTYTAAMDTAGKQLKSMQRYTEDLKVALGETFNEVLTVSVMALTSGLKDANGEVSEMAKNGQLHEWGHSLATIFVAIANAIDNVLTGMKMVGTWAGHKTAASEIDKKYTAMQIAVPEGLSSEQRRAEAVRINNERLAAQAQELKNYGDAQVTLGAMADRFQNAFDARSAAQLAKHKGEADAKLKVDQDYAKAASDILLKSAGQGAQAQEAARQKVIALYTQTYVGTPTYRDTEGREPKAKVDQVANNDLANELKRYEAEADALKQHNADLSTLDDMYHKAGELSDDAYFANKRKYSQDTADAQIAAYDKELAALVSHNNMTKAEAEKTAGEIQGISAKRAAAVERNAAEKFRLDEEERLRQAATISASDDATNKYISGLNAEAQKMDEANRGRETSRGTIERLAASRLDDAAAATAMSIAAAVENGESTAVIEMYQKMIINLNNMAAAKRNVASISDTKDAIAYKDKAADQAIKDWQRAGQSISESLTSAFGEGGKALGGMFQAYAKGMEGQLRAQKELAAAKKLAEDNPDKIAAINRAQLAGAQSQIQGYAGMTAAAQGFFSEGSKGYQAMHAATVALQSAEVALSLIKGVNAVLTQGEGDPYSAFVRMAAMAAIVTGLGVAIAGGSGGGGGQSAADVQKAQGTGSVFGDSSAKSDSIRRSIEQLTANSSDMLPINQGMLTALQNIESSMTGLTNLVVRTTGLTDGANMGIQTGTIATGGAVAIAGSAQVGSMIGGALAGPLGVWIGGAIGGAVSKLWGKTTQNIVDSGLQYGGSVRGLQAGKGFDQYASIDTTKSSFFGLSKSTSNRVEVQGLNDELSKQFGLIFTNLDKSLQAASVAMGGSAADVTKVLDSLTLESTKVSLKGLTGTALTDALNSVISKSMDEIAEAAFPQLDQFRKVGEGYAETVMRLAGDYAKLDSILAASSTTFGATGMASIAAREHLIELAGGIDQLATQTNSFTQNFLSKAEQLAPVQKYVTDQLAAMGLQSLDTRDKFKDYVLGLANSGALATEAGAQQYTALLALADAFAKTHAATVDLTKSEQEIADERTDLQNKLDDLTMTQVQLADKARAAIDAHNLALYDEVIAAQAARDAAKALLEGASTAYANLQTVVNAQKDVLNTAYQTAADGLQASIDSMTASVSKLQSLSDSLHSTLDSMTVPGQERSDRQAAQAQIAAALVIAKAGGPLPDADALKGALATVAKDASGQFSSYLDYQRDLYRTKNNVAGLAGFTDTELSTEQLTLKAIQGQKTALDEAHKQDLAALDRILEQAKAEADILNGIATSLMTLPQALAELAAAVAAVKGNPIAAAPSQAAAAYQQYLGRSATSSETDFWQQQAANGVDIVGAIKGSDEARIQGLYQSLLGRKGDAAGVDVWEAALKNGMTWDQVKQGFLGSDEYKKLHPPGFAAGGDHVGGLRLVGENGPEIEATGPSRIFNASQTRSILSGGDNAELVAEIRALRRQVANLENSGSRTANACETGTGLWKRVIRNDRVYASTKEEAAA